MSTVDEQVASLTAQFNEAITAIKNSAQVSAQAALQAKCHHDCVFCGTPVNDNLNARITALENASKPAPTPVTGATTAGQTVSVQ